MLRAYLDESGHEGKGWVCVAGFLGNDAQWKAFVPKWREALGPQRRFLHMSDLRWKKHSTKRLLARLGPVPHVCGLTGVKGVVRVADFDDLIVGTPGEKLYKGYFACVVPMVTQILRGIPKDERLELVFEQQREYEPLLNSYLSFFRLRDHRKYLFTSDGRPKLAKWSFVPKGSTVMTDPADYLAFALREMHTDMNSTKSEWCMPILGPAGPSGEAYGPSLTRDQVRQIVKRAQAMSADAGL